MDFLPLLCYHESNACSPIFERRGIVMKILRIILEIAITATAAILSAVALHTFVNPAGFAPSGIDGIAVMTQALTGINMGYVSLAINLPLLVVAWFFISRKYVIYTTLFTVISSAALIVMEQLGVSAYVSSQNGWVAVFASGILLGIRTALMIRIGGSSGGVDIIACVVQQKKPHLNIENIISLFCYIIIGLSFFVYHNIESVVMSVAQTMIFNFAMQSVLKTSRSAVEVRIITDDPEAFREDIITGLKHGATILEGKGMFTGDNRRMIVTIINMRQMSELIKLTRKHPNSFVYFSETNGVWGNFRRNKHDPAK